jgi:hypothetical protein
MFSTLKRAIVPLCLVASFALLATPQRDVLPQPVTVCEVLSHAMAYAGLRVRVTGKLQGTQLFAAGCSADLNIKGRQWPLAILIEGDSLGDLQERDTTPYGPGSNLIIEVTGVFEPMKDDAGFVVGNRSDARAFPARMRAVSVVSVRKERPNAISVCAVLANSDRYQDQVVAIEGSHRWVNGDQILYDPTCGPDANAVLISPENGAHEQPPSDTPLGSARVEVELIAKGRFEAWRAGNESSTLGKSGFGSCGCYRGQLRFAGFGYFRLKSTDTKR